MKYLLDTNVLSEAVKTTPETPDKSVMKMFERHQHEIVTAVFLIHSAVSLGRRVECKG
jgi:predicted nucleic acid-binding protein